MSTREAGTCPAPRAAAGIHGLFDLVERSTARRIAIIGLVKNAGKTTVVNALMTHVPHRFGLTSLGLDGERIDHLTGLAKPRIVPPVGTLVATTTGSLARSRYQMELIEELPFRTALGHVVIGVAGEHSAAVEISGPTTLRQVRATADRLLELGAHQVLVDGAINRLGSASPRVSDGVILATGAMAADSLEEVVHLTTATVDLLTLPVVDSATRHLLHGHDPAASRLLRVDSAGRTEALRLPSLVGQGIDFVRQICHLDTQTLIVGGAVTEEFVNSLLHTLPLQRKLRLVVRDPTVLILPASTVARLRRRVTLEVLHPLSVLAVTTNPFRLPRPLRPEVLFSAIADGVGDRLPVFDVVSDLARLPASGHVADGPRGGDIPTHHPANGR